MYIKGGDAPIVGGANRAFLLSFARTRGMNKYFLCPFLMSLFRLCTFLILTGYFLLLLRLRWSKEPLLPTVARSSHFTGLSIHGQKLKKKTFEKTVRALSMHRTIEGTSPLTKKKRRAPLSCGFPIKSVQTTSSFHWKWNKWVGWNGDLRCARIGRVS